MSYIHLYTGLIYIDKIMYIRGWYSNFEVMWTSISRWVHWVCTLVRSPISKKINSYIHVYIYIYIYIYIYNIHIYIYIYIYMHHFLFLQEFWIIFVGNLWSAKFHIPKNDKMLPFESIEKNPTKIVVILGIIIVFTNSL